MTHTSVAAGSSEAQKCDHWAVGGKPVGYQVSNIIFKVKKIIALPSRQITESN